MSAKVYELLAGRHVGPDPIRKRPDDGLPEEKLYLALDHTDPIRPVPHPDRFVESNVDLVSAFPNKFRLVEEAREETVEELRLKLARAEAKVAHENAVQQQTPVHREETIEELEAKLVKMKSDKQSTDSKKNPVQGQVMTTTNDTKQSVTEAAKQGFNTVHLDRLDQMTLQELMKLAEAEEIDIRGTNWDKSRLSKHLKSVLSKR